VDDHAPAKPASKRSWHKQADFAWGEAAPETSRDKDRYLCDAKPFELVDRRLDCFVPWVGCRRRDR
jgi:hypothetical protein